MTEYKSAVPRPLFQSNWTKTFFTTIPDNFTYTHRGKPDVLKNENLFVPDILSTKL